MRVFSIFHPGSAVSCVLIEPALEKGNSLKGTRLRGTGRVRASIFYSGQVVNTDCFTSKEHCDSRLL